jgi:hypothetical protein
MWSKFDDQFYLNPKSAMMDRDEQDLYFASVIYCNGQLTDGFIPAGVLVMLCIWAKIPIEANPQASAQAIASRLLEHGFWEEAEGGYMIHDFLDWNISRDEALALKDARSEAGRRGGKASVAKRQALAQASAQAKSKQNLTPSPSLEEYKKGADAPLSVEEKPQAEQPTKTPRVRLDYHNPLWDVAHGLTPDRPTPPPPDTTWLPADVIDLGTAFLTASKIPPPPDKSTRGYWIKELRSMRLEDCLSQDDLRRAVRKMRATGGIIKSPESLRTVALDIRAANESATFSEVY